MLLINMQGLLCCCFDICQLTKKGYSEPQESCAPT